MRALEEMQRLIDQNTPQLQDNSNPFYLLQQQTNPSTAALGGNPSNPLSSAFDGMNANQLQTQILLLQLQNAAQQQQRQEAQNMRRIQETLSQILQQQNQGRQESQLPPNQQQSTSSQGMFFLQQQLQLPPEQRMLPSAHNILSQLPTQTVTATTAATVSTSTRGDSMAPPAASSVSWTSLFPGMSTTTSALPSPAATTAAASSNTATSPDFDVSTALRQYANSAQAAGTPLPAPGNITLTPEQQLALLIACSNVVQEQQRNQHSR
jgi:hypothetical protein